EASSPMSPSSDQWNQPRGVSQANGAMSENISAPTSAPQKSEVSGCSLPATLRVSIWYSALKMAIAMGSSAYQVTTAEPGRTTPPAPIRPTAIATARDMSRRSPSIGTASTATNSGSTKPIAAASASGSTEREVK